RDPDGRVVLLEGVLLDVTEQYETRERLVASERLFRTAFEHAPIGMIITAADLSQATANPAFCAMVGLEPEEAGAEELLSVIDDEERADLARRWAALQAGEVDRYTIDRRLRRTDGSPVWGRFHVSALRDACGELVSILTQAVDLTDSRRAEAELRRLAESKDELLRVVSHELRTPLTTVVGLAAELAERHDAFDEAERRELTSLLADQANEMADLIDDLLALARTETGALQIDLVSVDVVREIEAVLSAWRGATPEVVAEGEHWVRVDPFRFRQILRNLLANAYKYGSEPVTITVEAVDEGCAVRVADAGPALPEEEWEAIFDRYYRASDLPGHPGSLGLGLALGRQLARLMSGDLTYRGIDGRSVFTLTLPIA
ncbi:MAG TPA: PAS domain S-box protein, partial [Actinobacteria bacterium]|nr:PAS domain S-box protein [Actinomycetota bacterium]